MIPAPALSLTALLIFVSVAQAQQTANQTVHDPVGQPYRLVEACHFEMGAREPEVFRHDHSSLPDGGDDRPIHPVILTRPFYVATHEVTVGQFRKFVDATDYSTTAESQSGAVGWDPVDDDEGRVERSFRFAAAFTWRDPGFRQLDSHPVVCVSYDDATAYCRWLSEQGEQGEGNYRLPTEAEWECAARAGSNSHFSFGDDYRESIHHHANHADASLEREAAGRASLQWLFDPDKGPDDRHAFTSPVASYTANDWGLHDMHGNVWEWCQDRYLDTYYSQFKRDGHQQFRRRAIDPVCTERWNEHGQWQVIRGGAWCVAPFQCRSATRGVFAADDAACYVGFRVVREADAEQVAAATAAHQQSERSLEALRKIAGAVREARDGQVRVELRGESLSPQVVEHLSHLNYVVDLQIRPPQRLQSEQIQTLQTIKQLQGLTIATGCDNVDSNTFALLSQYPDLQQLQITGNGDLSDDHLFQHLRDADQLDSLQLQGGGITDAGLSSLPELTRLTTLHITSTASEGDCLRRFHQSPLRQVSLGSLSDSGAALLAQFSTLRNLNLHGCPISDVGLRSIGSIRLLDDLVMPDCQQVTDEGFAALKGLLHLRRVDLQGTAAGDVAVRSLIGATTLERLSIGSDQLSDRGMRELCGLVSIQELRVSDDATEVTDAGLIDLWRLANLRELTMNAPKVTGSSLDSLAELSRLQRLNIGSTRLGDAACESIARIESLQELMLGDWGRVGPAALTEAGLLKLAEAPNLKRLTVMRKGTKITDDMIQRLKQMRSELQVSLR